MTTTQEISDFSVCLGAMEITFPSNISLLSLLQNPPVYSPSFNGPFQALPTQDGLYLGLADQKIYDCLNLGKQKLHVISDSKSTRTGIIYFKAPIDCSSCYVRPSIERLDQVLKPLYEKYNLSFKFAFYFFTNAKSVNCLDKFKLNYALSSAAGWSSPSLEDFYLPYECILRQTVYIWENGYYKTKDIFRIKPLDGPFVFIDGDTFKETTNISDSKCGFCNNAPICKLADNRNFCENFIVKHDKQSLYFNRYITDDYHKRAIKEWILESEKKGLPSF